MNTSKFFSKPVIFIGILIAIFFSIALYFRVCLPYDQVFSDVGIKFTSVDAYYHMRIVDNLVHNFPHLNSFDPYLIYPGGDWLNRIRFFDWLLAGIIWLIGLGSPTQHTIDVVGVYFPAILGALTVIPVYFIGKELFNRWAGVLSAALIALMPGEFLGRSILGFTDHHIAETLFSSVAILFLILAIKAARQRQLTFNHLKCRDWATSTKPLVYALLTGISLAIYLITWGGGPLFVFIISIYLIIQFIIDHLKHQSTDYLCIIAAVLFLVTLIIFVPFSPGRVHLYSLIIALLIPLVLSGVSRLMVSKEIKPAYFPLTLVGVGLAGLAIFYIINPSLLGQMLGAFSIFMPGGASLTTLEMQPLLFPGGKWTIGLAWGNFTTSFFFSFISLGILIYLVIKQGNAEKSLLLVWSLVILAATLGQRRFAYYFVINVTLLTGYLSWQFLQFVALLTDRLFGRIQSADFRKRIVKSLEMPQMAAPEELEMPQMAAPEEAKPKKGHKDGFYTIKYIFMALAVIIVLLFVFFPNIKPAVAVAQQARFAPSDAWCSSLSWLKENTPVPFADTDFYYKLYEPLPPGESYDYPESAYGVTAWWDYGYWITRIGHRLTNTSPGQSPEPIINVAHLFLSQEEFPIQEEEFSPQEIMQKLGSSYIIIDYMTTTSKFWAIVTWAGSELTKFSDVYYLPYEGKIVPVSLYYPEYYRSICTRLYNFDGKAVTPESLIVISYEEKVSQKDKPYKLITGIQLFPSYREALDYIESQESANCRIVGNNPFISPVPLEALRNYKLVYSSDIGVLQPEVGMVPEVKIFEYIGH